MVLKRKNKIGVTFFTKTYYSNVIRSTRMNDKKGGFNMRLFKIDYNVQEDDNTIEVLDYDFDECEDSQCALII